MKSKQEININNPYDYDLASFDNLAGGQKEIWKQVIENLSQKHVENIDPPLDGVDIVEQAHDFLEPLCIFKNSFTDFFYDVSRYNNKDRKMLQRIFQNQFQEHILIYLVKRLQISTQEVNLMSNRVGLKASYKLYNIYSRLCQIFQVILRKGIFSNLSLNYVITILNINIFGGFQ